MAEIDNLVHGVSGDVGDALNDHLFRLAGGTLLVVAFISFWQRGTPIYVGLCVAVRCHMTSSSAQITLAGSELAVLACSNEGSLPCCRFNPKDVGVASVWVDAGLVTVGLFAFDVSKLRV